MSHARNSRHWLYNAAILASASLAACRPAYMFRVRQRSTLKLPRSSSPACRRLQVVRISCTIARMPGMLLPSTSLTSPHVTVAGEGAWCICLISLHVACPACEHTLHLLCIGNCIASCAIPHIPSLICHLRSGCRETHVMCFVEFCEELVDLGCRAVERLLDEPIAALAVVPQLLCIVLVPRCTGHFHGVIRIVCQALKRAIDIASSL